jgi:hypothetical protein
VNNNSIGLRVASIMCLVSFLLGAIVGGLLRGHETKKQIETIKTKENIVTQKAENIVSKKDEVTKDLGTKNEVKTRTIVKYYHDGKVKEVEHENTNTQDNKNKVAEISKVTNSVSNETSRINRESEVQRILVTSPSYNNTFMFLVNPDISNHSNSNEIGYLYKVIGGFSIGSTVDLVGLQFKSIRLGVAYSW